MPPSAPGMAIGLFGGSFDPAHEGHLMVCDMALRRLGLDRVWWIVTPGNPLKATEGRPSQAARMAAAAALIDDPRVAVTGFEARIGTRYTAQVLAWLTRRRSDVDFVWIMGADNLRQLHLWKDWRAIAAAMPMAIVDRPGATLSGPLGRAGRALAGYRVAESAAPTLARRAPPAWTLLHGPRSPL
ncbi:MAG: nicotinate-nucleotide adenylyltransferase, partial [Methylobacteriaceae bacterium]|nr:nicotinate-nucleotide adenylyltransferase [Methylobacteriaceae bacterium]